MEIPRGADLRGVVVDDVDGTAVVQETLTADTRNVGSCAPSAR